MTTIYRIYERVYNPQTDEHYLQDIGSEHKSKENAIEAVVVLLKKNDNKSYTILEFYCND